MTSADWPRRASDGPAVVRARRGRYPQTGEVGGGDASRAATTAGRYVGIQTIRSQASDVAVGGGRTRAVFRVIVPAAAISLLVIVGTSLGSGALVTVGAALALLAAVAVPEVGLAVVASLAPLQPPPGIPTPGLNFLLVGALLVGCVYRLPIDRPALRLSRPGLLLVGFVAYASAQQLPTMLGGYAGDDGHLIGYLFFQLLTGFGLVLAAAYILRGRSPIAVLTMALVGALVATTVSIATFDSPVSGPPFAGLVATADAGLRAAGPFVNPNYMGTFAAAVLVGVMAIWMAVRSPIRRSLLAGLAILCVVALVQAQSRGAMVAGFAGVAAVLWLRSRPLALAVVGVGLVTAVLIYPAFVEWRLTNLRGDVTDAGYVAMIESDDARLGATLAGPAMFMAEPIFGVGFGEYVHKSVEVSGLGTGINAHNWYINVLAEQGTTGAILWFGATVATIAELRARRGVARLVGVGVFTTLAIGFLFLEGPTSFQLIAVPSLFLIAALSSDWTDVQSRQAGIGDVDRSRGSRT